MSQVVCRPVGRVVPLVPALLAALAGCGDGPTAPPPLQWPMTVGTRWTYVRTDSVELGTPFSPRGPTTHEVRVVRDVVLGGRRGAVLDSGALLFGLGDGELILASASDGVSVGSTLATPSGLSPWRLLLPHPTLGSRPTMLGWTVVNPDTTITVPAGTFRTVRYDAVPGRLPEGRISVFLAEGTGVVLFTGPIAQWRDGAGTLKGQWRSVHRLTAVTTPGS